jgi:hypothetical protein
MKTLEWRLKGEPVTSTTLPSLAWMVAAQAFLVRMVGVAKKLRR